jgi:hypothetical protein
MGSAGAASSRSCDAIASALAGISPAPAVSSEGGTDGLSAGSVCGSVPFARPRPRLEDFAAIGQFQSSSRLAMRP